MDKRAKSAEKALDDFLDHLVDQDGEPEASAPAESIGDTLIATEQQAIQAHFQKCWNVPAGTRGALDISVDITLYLNDDGTIREAEIEDKKRLATDPVFRTVAESAKRAALDPACRTLNFLPKKKYNAWKKLLLDFNPKLMAGISGGIR